MTFYSYILHPPCDRVAYNKEHKQNKLLHEKETSFILSDPDFAKIKKKKKFVHITVTVKKLRQKGEQEVKAPVFRTGVFVPGRLLHYVHKAPDHRTGR